jgi:threonyl-tRNA synthetase
VFCREEDVPSEIDRFVALLSKVYADFGFPKPEVSLSIRPLARAGSDELWDWAEETLAGAARQCSLSYKIQPGEGAFYGPKLEFALRDRLGRSWQCGINAEPFSLTAFSRTVSTLRMSDRAAIA